jgi:hypothetical protein
MPADVVVPPRSPGIDGGLRLIAETTIFTGGGTLAFDPRIAELRTVPRARMHPDIANALGIADGEPVTVSAANGASLRELVAVLDPRVPVGAVALVDGLPLAPLNALGYAATVRLEKALVTA